MFIKFDQTATTARAAVDRLQELDRLLSRLHAIQADLLVTAAGPDPQVDEYWITDGLTDEQRVLLIEDPIRDELACALRRSSNVMQSMIDTARLLSGPLRPTWQALHAGEITINHVWAIAEVAVTLPADVLGEFQRRVLGRACGGSLARTRRAVREAVAALDAGGYDRRRRQAACTKDVRIFHEPDGISVLMARLATEQAIAVMTQIDAAAHASDAGGPMGEKRAEALASLILGGDGAAATAPTTAHLNVTMALDTLLVLQGVVSGDASTAELAGFGPVSATMIRDLLADPDCAITLRRLVTDPVTGHLLDYGRKTYAIPQALRDYVIARDRTCRFPGCNRRADLCQLDHAIAWDDAGETKPANLGALCTRHHQLKTHGGWQITVSRPDGSCTWQSPQGRVYEHEPPETTPRE